MVDLATVAGLLLAMVAVVATVIWEGGSLMGLISPSAAFLIFGGTIGATVIGFRGADLRKVPGAVLSAFMPPRENPRATLDLLVRMAEKARREGLLALQEHVPSLEHPLLAHGLQLVIDGTDPDHVEETLHTQIELTERSRMTAASILETAGGFAPTIGIIGTVMGLVTVLQSLSEPEKLGHSIALAFLATFYGVASANLFWLPLANKVKQNIANDGLINRMYLAGIVGLQTGEAPRALRDRLGVFLYNGAGTRRAESSEDQP